MSHIKALLRKDPLPRLFTWTFRIWFFLDFGLSVLILCLFPSDFAYEPLHRAIENIATCFTRVSKWEEAERGREEERQRDYKKEALRENANKRGVTMSSNLKISMLSLLLYSINYEPLVHSILWEEMIWKHEHQCGGHKFISETACHNIDFYLFSKMSF